MSLRVIFRQIYYSKKQTQISISDKVNTHSPPIIKCEYTNNSRKNNRLVLIWGYFVHPTKDTWITITRFLVLEKVFR